jgi:uncharacterized protein (DUF1800 family)
MPEPDLEALLLNRVAFGPRPGEVERARQIGANAWINEQLDYESIDDSEVEDRINRDLATLTMSSRQIWTNYRMNNQGQIFQELALATIYRMVYSKRMLYETMVEFWTDHLSMDFQANQVNFFKTADDRDVIRPNALGKFKDLLKASAQSPAMLNYLNNDVSRKGNPNENYAREIMELHTLGAAVDGVPYTETDVKEVARCFTGWSWDSGQNSPTWGDFEFRQGDHDNGVKTVLGEFIGSNNWKGDGDIVIDLLCAQEATARFLATKLIRRFVTDDPLGQTPGLLDRVAETYKRTDGDIRDMLYTILTSQEFASSFATYGGRLSRPMDFVARALRVADVPSSAFALSVGDRAGNPLYGRINYALQSMGHIPFYWPTPDGYPDTKEAWSSSIGILTRWNFGLALCGVGNTRDNPLGASLVNGFILQEQMPASVKTVGEAVDYWTERLLHRALNDADRALIIDYLSDGGSASAPVQGLPNGRLSTGIALIIDSPYFQWR